MSRADNTREARPFAVWRQGEKLGWRCTVAEIAEAVKLTTLVVERICGRRGWKPEGLAANKQPSLKPPAPGPNAVRVELGALGLAHLMPLELPE